MSYYINSLIYAWIRDCRRPLRPDSFRDQVISQVRNICGTRKKKFGTELMNYLMKYHVTGLDVH